MAISVRDEGSKVNSNINVTPMVDVMLVLLIIFMVITPMVQNKVSIDLPKAETAVVMPDADKQVYFRGDVRAPYGKVMDTIDSIRTAGVEELGLLADQRQPVTPAK